MVIYVDGSWIKNKVRWSFAVLNGNKIEHFESGTLHGNALSNVDGELTAVIKALEYASKVGAKQVEIRYDYEGIKKFATKEWTARSNAARDYIANMERFQTHINITFTKVNKKDAMNLAVDALARGNVSDMLFYASKVH